jgi:hypothetical protein
MGKTFGHVKFETQGGGFFSNFFYVMSMLIDCHQRGLQPYVDLGRTSFVEGYNPYFDPIPVNPDNPWDNWFDQEQPTIDDILEPVEFSTAKFAHDIHLWKREDLPHARMVADKYVHIKQNILDQTENHYNRLLLGKTTLGVMARGCEFNTYHPEFGKQTIESWVSAIRNILRTHPEINNIFLVTEDSSYIPILSKEFTNVVYLDVFRRTKETMNFMINTPLWPSMNSPRANHCKLLGEECLMQALLLGRCDYMLVKQCGTSSGAIFYATENLKDVYYCE